ncbi:MAG: hypothetical protein EOP48_27500, partial [Sphingobacteriales bacterium]
MSLLKCGIIIPELNTYLIKSGIAKEAFEKYYDKYACFELNDIQGIEYITDDSILCVAYNLLSRGYPTLGSLDLAVYLLQKHFPDAHAEYKVKEERECFVAFESLFSQPFEDGEAKAFGNLLINWHEEAFSTASAELGSTSYRFFALFEDLRKAAFVQKALLFALFAHPGKRKLNVFMDLDDDSVAAFIVDDLKTLLSSLAILADKEIPAILYT